MQSQLMEGELKEGSIINACEEMNINSNRKAMNRNWSNQKANPALKDDTDRWCQFIWELKRMIKFSFFLLQMIVKHVFC